MVSKKLKKIIDEDKEYLFQNYGRLDACFVKGDGSYLYDQDNRRYIDFFSGIAVSSLGYNNKSLNKALHGQIDRIIHSSNWYFNREQIDAARLISNLSFPCKTLFVNSGTEANEAAIKLARKFGLSKSGSRYEIISFKNSFHGRTFGSMTATGQEKIHKGFGPLPRGFKYLPYNNIEKFREEISKNANIAAVMIELIQGEGGIIIADKHYIREISSLCQKKGIAFIVDEIQTGIGRTGKNFAYQHYGIIPDIITLAKGLGGGIPVGALHAKDTLSEYFTRGTHGSTFGGNHFAAAASSAVLRELQKGAILKNVETVSRYFFKELHKLKDVIRIIKDVRGMGLHIGVELKKPGMDMVKSALHKGLVINCTAERTIRIMPPLNITLKAAREGINILRDILIIEDDK